MHRNVSVEDVAHVVLGQRGFEEVILHLDGEAGQAELPFVIVADREADGRIDELRLYYSNLLAHRPPREPPTAAAARPRAALSDVVRSTSGARDRRRRRDRRGVRTGRLRPHTRGRPAQPRTSGRPARLLRAVVLERRRHPLELCTVIDDGRACALEYNLVRWGRTQLPPQAGVAVYARDESGRPTAARRLRRRRSAARSTDVAGAPIEVSFPRLDRHRRGGSRR